ncbi:hypothetical protein ES288_D12G239900v1 [Gossypium darwinii]|uniref:Endonuclease/exonuclease/phosphatase domain-containing protein n=1 Tax=Gossypium darwinii TaxID=34276 RepID=A0A5D2ABL6_GOSDA|nr:hypothetical protein ES288_D12G239900v1 [Gossypium darwinii]
MVIIGRTTTLALIIPRLPLLCTISCSPRLSVSSKLRMSTSASTNTGGSGKSALVIREFVSVEGGGGNARDEADAIRFRLVSYNILAQVYVKSSLFPHSPSPCLRWKARSQVILTLLKDLGADFYSLQEVDEFDSFYKTSMEDLGYSSIYVQRSGQKRDGCGIFYKKNCAELLLEETIEYNDLVPSLHDEAYLSSDKQNAPLTNRNNGDSSKQDLSEKFSILSVKSSPENRGDPNDPRVRLKRDCVGIMAAFKLKHPFHHVVILANTHLYWDPEWADVKLVQAKYLLACLAQFKTLVTDRFECTPSLILTGDFNSTPGDKICREKCSPEHRGDPNDPCGRLKRDCVGIMAAFKLKQPFHHAVAHLYWFFSILFLVTLHHRIDVWKNFPFPCAVFMLRQEENHYLRPTPPPLLIHLTIFSFPHLTA